MIFEFHIASDSHDVVGFANLADKVHAVAKAIASGNVEGIIQDSRNNQIGWWNVDDDLMRNPVTSHEEANDAIDFLRRDIGIRLVWVGFGTPGTPYYDFVIKHNVDMKLAAEESNDAGAPIFAGKQIRYDPLASAAVRSWLRTKTALMAVKPEEVRDLRVFEALRTEWLNVGRNDLRDRAENKDNYFVLGCNCLPLLADKLLDVLKKEKPQ